MAILRQPACTPESSAPSTATATAVAARPNPGEVNVICVDYIDHGERETPWGLKPQVSIVFEASVNGSPKWFTRTYNNYAFSKSALTIDIKNWLGRDISGKDQDWDIADCVGEQATLKTSDVLSKAGNQYKKIETVKPGGTDEIEASGTYERLDQEI
jgi:hypothetical protein